MLPAGNLDEVERSSTSSSAPEDGRNYRPKHVELIGIINKQLLLQLLGCLYYRNCNILEFTLKLISNFI